MQSNSNKALPMIITALYNQTIVVMKKMAFKESATIGKVS